MSLQKKDICSPAEIEKLNKHYTRSQLIPGKLWMSTKQFLLNNQRLKSVTKTAQQRVRRVRKWVFSFSISKVLVPLLISSFLLILNPHKDIQVGFTAILLVFFLVFFYQTTELQYNRKRNSGTLLSLYRLLPLNSSSYLWGKLTTQELPYPLSFISVWLFATITGCNRDEAEFRDLRQYKTVSQFFTRKLKPGIRPISSDSDLVSPCDGTLTFQGIAHGDALHQVKGVTYSLKTFLGDLYSISEANEVSNNVYLEPCYSEFRLLLSKQNGSTCLYQTVIYLAPSDYHRFHSPANWKVTRRRHFSGHLLSVTPTVSSLCPGLFHSNERVAFIGSWDHGFFALVAVGATNVGSIAVCFDPHLKTNERKSFDKMDEMIFEKPIQFRKGQEFGHFNFGSTIVLLYEAPLDAFDNSSLDKKLKMGEGLMAKRN